MNVKLCSIGSGIRWGVGQRSLILGTSVCLLLAACGKEAPKLARPSPEVTTMVTQARTTPVTFQFVGQTQSSREVEIRARVDGFLEKRLYTEGDLVRPNQPMFQMDKKPFEATLQSAKGQLAESQAQLDVAEANLKRIRPLAAQKAVSQKDLDDAIGNQQKAAASVYAAQGQVQSAQLNLGYTTIYSPLLGLSSYAKQQEGAYLSPSNSLLTTVSQLDPIWVNFSISENQLLRFEDEQKQGRLIVPPDRNFGVEAVLADGRVFPARGRISFTDPSFSKETGTFLVRAVLANINGAMRPGQFVRVNVLGATRPNAILVPQRSVMQNAKGNFVWVITKEGKAEVRPVAVGEWLGDEWFITEGLQPGETVVVDGAQTVQPGVAVKASPYVAKVAATILPPTTTPKTLATASAAPGTSRASTGLATAPTVMPAVAPGATAVYFDSGNGALSREARRAIDALAASLKATTTAVTVTGYADRTGNAEHNVELAQQRAQSVRDALVAAGLVADRVALKAPVAVVGSGTDREARRVDIGPAAAPAK